MTLNSDSIHHLTSLGQRFNLIEYLFSQIKMRIITLGITFGFMANVSRCAHLLEGY